MHYLAVWLTVKEKNDVAKVKGLLAQAAALSRAEPGCRRFELYHSQTDETKFLLCEHWETKAAWETHRTARAYCEIYQPQVLPLVTREGHPMTLVEG